jgi:hypothetical protein
MHIVNKSEYKASKTPNSVNVKSVNEGKSMACSPWSHLLAEQCIKKTLCIVWTQNIAMCLVANHTELKMEIDSLLPSFRHEQQKQEMKILE